MGNFEARTTQSIPTDDIESIYINWTAGRVAIGRHHGDDIQITEFSQRELRDGEEFRVNTTDGTLRINFSDNINILRNTPAKRLEVLIPYEFDEFDEFYIRTMSGRININNLNALNIEVSTVSGRIELNQIHSHYLNVSTTSGRIEVHNANTFDTNLRTVSGRIEISNSNAQNLESRTTSGRHQISGEFEDITARSVSGRIEIIGSTIPTSIAANTTSGRIEVSVPNEGEPISVWHSLTSGRFSSDIPVTLQNADDAQFRFSTTSGSVRIHTLN